MAPTSLDAMPALDAHVAGGDVPLLPDGAPVFVDARGAADAARGVAIGGGGCDCAIGKGRMTSHAFGPGLLTALAAMLLVGWRRSRRGR
jgi:hypothetical protein